MRRRYWLPPLILLLTLLAGLFFLLGTPPGTRFVLSQAVRRVPGLKIDRVDGTLLGRLALEGIDYRQPGLGVSLERLSLEWRPSRLLGGAFDLSDLLADGVDYRQAPEEKTAAAPSGDFTLPAFNLPVRVIVEKAVVRTIALHRGEQVTRLDAISLSGEVDRTGLHLRQLDVQAAAFEIGLKGELRSEAAASPAHPAIEASLRWSTTEAAGAAAQGEGEIKGNLQRLQLTHRVTRPFTLGTEGSVSLAGGVPSIDLQGGWQGVRWPIEAKADEKSTIESPQGTYRLKGTADDYRFEIGAALQGAQLPAAELSLAGAGNQKQVALDPLRIKTLKGEISGDGTFGWEPALRWQVRLAGKDLHPDSAWPEWKGVLSFAAGSKGELTGKGPVGEAALSKFKGTLRGYPVSAEAALSMKGENYHLQRLAMRSGSAALDASGKLADLWDLTWNLRAPDLAALWPDAIGSLAGDGTVGGPRLKPIAKAQLSGKGLAVQERKLKKLALTVQVDLQDRLPSRIDLKMEGVKIGAQQIAVAGLTAAGRLSKHQVEADVRTADQQLNVRLEGGLVEKKWEGKLNQADLRDKNAGVWKLQKPVALAADLGKTGKKGEASTPAAVRVEEACWAGPSASGGKSAEAPRFCAAGRWQQEGGWEANARAQKLPLALLKPFLPADLTLSGTIDGEGSGKSEGNRTAAQAKLIPSPGTLLFRPADGEKIQVGYQEGLLQADLKEGALKAAAKLTLIGQGYLQAEIGLARQIPEGDWSTGRLQGKVDLQLTQLGLLSALTPMVEESSGRIDLHAGLGGTLDRPAIKGEATLRQGALRVPSLGIHLTELQLTLQSEGAGPLTVRGGAKSGPGNLQIGGTVSLDAKAGFPARLTFKGERFQLLDTQEAKLLASPDLALQIQKPRISLAGEVLVPDATVTLRELPKGAVKVSDDTVIVNDNTKRGGAAGAKKEPWEISANVMIRLGEKVNFSGFGLTARVAGEIRAIDQPGKLTTGDGQLRILDGQYRAYGQKLDIAQGRLIFAGPLNNPGLDFRATRKADKEEVTAGIQVRGTLQAPETTLFSDPPMDQADALAYLLLGRPLNQASSSEGDFLTKAIAALELKGGDFLAKKIGRKLGLDEVKVEAGEKTEQATLVVGRYFSPKFYVSYGIGLFESINTLHVRYKINQKLTLQGESGAESGMDLIYTKEYR